MKRAACIVAVVLSGAAPVRALVPNATAWAQGGIDALDRLERSPGARVALGASVGIDSWQIDPVAGIDAVALRVTRRTARFAMAASVDRIQSPVHHDRGITLGAQLHTHTVTAGLALEARRLEFTNGDHAGDTRARAGFGMQSGSFAAVAVLEAPANQRVAPQVRIATEWRAAGAVRIQTQLDREPGSPSRWRLAAAWRTDPITWFGGYDNAIDAATLGLACGLGRCRIVWGARAHPDLGWSHLWTCEWRL